MRKVVRLRSGYKRRRSDGSIRAFGGINVLFFGDWWQLRPVGGKALFSNPLGRQVGLTPSGLNIFWGSGPDSLRGL